MTIGPQNEEQEKALAKRAFRAIAKGVMADLAAALKDGAPLEARNEMDETLLLYALQKGRTKMALFLIDAKADINAQGRDLRTPLMLSLAQSFNGVAQKLLEKNADTTLKDKFSATALAIVKSSGNSEGAQLLFARMGREEAQQQAIWAIREEDLASLKFLAEKMGVKMTEAGANGLRPADEMALWMGGEIADYVQQRSGIETANAVATGLSDSVEAPHKASFTKKPKP